MRLKMQREDTDKIIVWTRNIKASRFMKLWMIRFKGYNLALSFWQKMQKIW